MVSLLATGIVSALVLVAYVRRDGAAPDVERMAGRMWAGISQDSFSDCPRRNGFRFWQGCTDLTPSPRRSRP